MGRQRLADRQRKTDNETKRQTDRDSERKRQTETQ